MHLSSGGRGAVVFGVESGIDVKGGGLTNGALVQILDCNFYATSCNQR